MPVEGPDNAAGATVRSVRTSEARISYRAQGSGQLVLILASTGRGTEEFGPLAECLVERGFRVLRAEPRGVGASTGPIDGVSFHDFAGDFAAVIRAEGGGPAIVVGHAYGNLVARTIAADHPDLARGVVLVAAGAVNWPKELSEAITMINDPASTREQRLQGLRFAFFAEGSDPTAWLDGWHPAVMRSQRAARALTDEADWWGAGSAPILDLQADLDPFRPAESRDEIRAVLGDRVTVQVIAGASHALPTEKPQAVADAIADWADRLPV